MEFFLAWSPALLITGAFFLWGILIYTGRPAMAAAPWDFGGGFTLFWVAGGLFCGLFSLCCIPLVPKFHDGSGWDLQLLLIRALECFTIFSFFVALFVGPFFAHIMPPIFMPRYLRDAWKYGVDYYDVPRLRAWARWRRTPEFKEFKASGQPYAPREFLGETTSFHPGHEHLREYAPEMYGDGTYIFHPEISRLSRIKNKLLGTPLPQPLIVGPRDRATATRFVEGGPMGYEPLVRRGEPSPYLPDRLQPTPSYDYSAKTTDRLRFTHWKTETPRNRPQPHEPDSGNDSHDQ